MDVSKTEGGNIFTDLFSNIPQPIIDAGKDALMNIGKSGIKAVGSKLGDKLADKIVGKKTPMAPAMRAKTEAEIREQVLRDLKLLPEKKPEKIIPIYDGGRIKMRKPSKTINIVKGNGINIF